MSCNCNCNCKCNCNKANTVIVLPKKKPVKAPIHQLKEDGESIYPVTLTSAVHNPKTGENLDIMLSKHNHLYLVYQGNFADTVEEVPEEYRHEGLVVTFTNCRGEIKHKIYKGVSKNNCSFTDKANWEDFIKTEGSDSNDKAPSNLRYEGNTIKLDVVNKTGVVIETLSAPLTDNTDDKWYKNTSLTLNGTTLELVQTSNTGKECKKTLDLTPLLSKIKPGFKAQVSPTVPTVSNAEPGVIYVVPNTAVPGTAREYILVESPLGRYIEQLGSASGMCSILNEKLDNSNNNSNNPAKDNRLLRAELNEKVLTLTVGNDTSEHPIEVDLSPIIPQESEPVDLSSITSRLDALESKQDKDTIYNDTEIKNRIKALEDRPVGGTGTAYDDTQLSNRVTALEDKVDADTYPTNLEVLDTETPTTKKIKLTLNNSKSPLEANINIPQSTEPITNESFIVFLTQQDYDAKLAQGSLDAKKLYIIVPQVG